MKELKNRYVDKKKVARKQIIKKAGLVILRACAGLFLAWLAWQMFAAPAPTTTSWPLILKITVAIGGLGLLCPHLLFMFKLVKATPPKLYRGGKFLHDNFYWKAALWPFLPKTPSLQPAWKPVAATKVNGWNASVYKADPAIEKIGKVRVRKH
jgi:hypothetical protein